MMNYKGMGVPSNLSYLTEGAWRLPQQQMGPDFSVLGDAGTAFGRGLKGRRENDMVSRFQQALGPESQASWALGTDVKPGGGMDYGRLWQLLGGWQR